MKNIDLYNLKEVIKRVKDKGTNKFKLPLILNEMKIDEHLKALEELRKPSEKFQEFEAKRRELVMKHAEKDENGNVILYSEKDGKGIRIKDGYGFPKIVKDKEEYERKFEALREEYKDTIEAEEKKAKEFEKTLSEDADIELKKIPFEEVPELKYDDLKVLMPFIEQ